CKLDPGKVYLVPSNRHVTIEEGVVTAESDHRARPRPSVDLLLSTASQAYGDRLIAVILTGSGTDGASGAVDVKSAGGTVIIQNPATARYPSMPLALPPTIVDHVVDVEKLAPLLHALVRHIAIPDGQEDDAVRDVLGVVTRQTSLDFLPYKRTTILRRIARRMAVTHKHTIQEYRALLEDDADEVRELVMAVLIKVTEFFRDAEAFEYIKEEILPPPIARASNHGRTLRFCSARC